MLKLPSLNSLVQGAVSTFGRFPLVLLSAIAGTAVSLYLTKIAYYEQQDIRFLYNIILCCSLGLPLFAAIDFFAESKNAPAFKTWAWRIAALILLIIYYFSLPEKLATIEYFRFAVINLGLHFLVAFSPFIGKLELNGFWQFNKVLFIRILTAVLYSGVLYVGLVLALLSVDELFDVKINSKYYFRLWIVIAGVFNTWFFLAGLPKEIKDLNNVYDYPKGLKVFTQYVLLPLVTLYLVILYAYSIKILIDWQLPKGWVSYLVLGFSVTGVLSLLLIYPIKEQAENSWIKIFSKWFYRMLFPLIILLFIAIYKRISDYGITESRYYVLVLALWLAGIAAYFLLSKVKNIKYIPITLFLVAFLSSFGPWGAFSISEKSQVNRLENLLVENDILVNNKIIAAKDTLPYEDAAQISSIVRYLDDTHGYDNIKHWFDQDLDSLFLGDSTNRYLYKPQIVLDLMGVENYHGWENYAEDRKNFNYYSENSTAPILIKGFDYLVNFNVYQYRGDADEFNKTDFIIGNDSFELKYNLARDQFMVKKQVAELITFNLHKFLADAHQYAKATHKNNHSSYFPAEKLMFETENDKIKIKIYFSSIYGERKEEKMTITGMDGKMLLIFK